MASPKLKGKTLEELLQVELESLRSEVEEAASVVTERIERHHDEAAQRDELASRIGELESELASIKVEVAEAYLMDDPKLEDLKRRYQKLSSELKTLEAEHDQLDRRINLESVTLVDQLKPHGMADLLKVEARALGRAWELEKLLARFRREVESARAKASDAFSRSPGQAVTPAEKRRAELAARAEAS